MSTYTYNHQELKASGIQFPAMLVLKNKLKYKMISAEDIAWDVKLNEGTNKEASINSTNDLLDYISGVDYRIDNVESSNIRYYRIVCSISVCYSGTSFNKSPEIFVYKTIGEQDILMSYNDLVAEGVQVLSSSSLIHFASDGLYLNGTATSGIHTLTLKKDDNIVASFTLTVLNKPEKTYFTTIYTESETRPDVPTGGSYNDTNNTFTAPSGWTDNYSSLNHDNKIWFSMGTVFLNNQSVKWSEPCLYITKEALVDNNKYLTAGVAVYKSVATKQIENGIVIDVTPKIVPATPTGGSYSFETGLITAPSEWSNTPELAAQEYKKIASEKLKSFYKTYVSFNNYTVIYDGSIYKSIQSTGWTDPVEYIDIDGILNSAQLLSLQITNAAIVDATNDINNSVKNIHDVLLGEDGNGGTIKDLTDQVNDIQATVGDFSAVSAVVDSLKVLYNWQKVDQLPEGLSATIIYDIFTEGDLKNSEKYNSSEWYNKYVKLGDNGNYYFYTATSAELTTQLQSLKNTVNEQGTEITNVSTTVNKMTDDYIRLQASKGNLSDVTWTAVEDTDWNAATNKVSVSDLPTERYSTSNTNGYRFGYYYKLTKSIPYTYYRCDYPISTGFLNILSERVSLGIANNTTDKNGLNKGANITFSITKEGTSQSAISSETIVLNGDTIAAAIAAKSLNIDNYTYLFSKSEANTRSDKAMAIFGGGTNGNTMFKTDGSGHLAGGNISWGSNGGLTVNGEIRATSGYIGDEISAWVVGLYGSAAALFGTDSINHKEIVLSTEYLGGGPEDNHSWTILNDGTATFANENVVFNNDGSGYIGIHNNSTGTTKGITIDEDGNVSLNGVDVTITADKVLQLGSFVENKVNNAVSDDTFVGIIADAAAGKVNVLGDLNTQDVYVGNNACFFDGTGSDAGAGHVASGAIKWDKNGNIVIKGNYDFLSNTSSYGSDITVKHWNSTNGRSIDIPRAEDYIGRELTIKVVTTVNSLFESYLSTISNVTNHANIADKLPRINISSIFKLNHISDDMIGIANAIGYKPGRESANIAFRKDLNLLQVDRSVLTSALLTHFDNTFGEGDFYIYPSIIGLSKMKNKEPLEINLKSTPFTYVDDDGILTQLFYWDITTSDFSVYIYDENRMKLVYGAGDNSFNFKKAYDEYNLKGYSSDEMLVHNVMDLQYYLCKNINDAFNNVEEVKEELIYGIPYTQDTAIGFDSTGDLVEKRFNVYNLLKFKVIQ